jgi:hypothetical protein
VFGYEVKLIKGGLFDVAGAPGWLAVNVCPNPIGYFTVSFVCLAIAAASVNPNALPNPVFESIGATEAGISWLPYPNSEKLDLAISSFIGAGCIGLASTGLTSIFGLLGATGAIWSVGASARLNGDLLKITEGYFSMSFSSVNGLTLIFDSVTDGILLFSPNESKAC